MTIESKYSILDPAETGVGKSLDSYLNMFIRAHLMFKKKVKLVSNCAPVDQEKSSTLLSTLHHWNKSTNDPRTANEITIHSICSGDSNYLENTWHNSTRPNLSDLTPQPFVKLEILDSSPTDSPGRSKSSDNSINQKV